MDTPQEFVKDVLDADRDYANGIDINTLVGNFRVELLGMTRDSARSIGKPIVQPFLDIARDKLNGVVTEIKKIIDNPPQCIDDETVYQGVQYISVVEAPYAEALIDNTFLDNEVEIPRGTDEFLHKLSRIPKCSTWTSMNKS